MVNTACDTENYRLQRLNGHQTDQNFTHHHHHSILSFSPKSWYHPITNSPKDPAGGPTVMGLDRRTLMVETSLRIYHVR